MFYHLFQNRDKKYIYDVNCNLVSYISDELFTDLQKQHSCNELCEKEYEILLEKDFLKIINLNNSIILFQSESNI